jgi:hypothetical protein
MNTTNKNCSAQQAACRKSPLNRELDEGSYHPGLPEDLNAESYIALKELNRY